MIQPRLCAARIRGITTNSPISYRLVFAFVDNYHQQKIETREVQEQQVLSRVRDLAHILFKRQIGFTAEYVTSGNIVKT